MVYIHIPFCIRKCLYCDFYSVSDFSCVQRYVDALIKEMHKYKGMYTETIYIGGGTPNSIGNYLVEIVKEAKKTFTISDNCEFTVEANPGASGLELFSELSKNGVNRISLGAQSFVDDELKALGRIHSAKDIFLAVDAIKSAGINNINLDLMLAIPNQTMKSLDYSIDCIEKINSNHVSAYSLIIEENTPFFKNTPQLPDEDVERDMYWHTVHRLKEIGYSMYEISNFAKKGFESRHNSRYWLDYEYIGIGAGAHSYFNGQRFENIDNIEEYISGRGHRQNLISISKKERTLELFMLGLRMTEGISYNGEFSERVEPLIKKGLLEIENGRLKLTKRGIDLGNLVFMEFLDD